jgi:hypothetical protein
VPKLSVAGIRSSFGRMVSKRNMLCNNKQRSCQEGCPT